MKRASFKRFYGASFSLLCIFEKLYLCVIVKEVMHIRLWNHDITVKAVHVLSSDPDRSKNYMIGTQLYNLIPRRITTTKMSRSNQFASLLHFMANASL